MAKVSMDQLIAAGIPAELGAMIIELTRLADKEPKRGLPGRGIESVGVDETTGQVTFRLTDGTSIRTPPLRGKDIGIAEFETDAEAEAWSVANPDDLVISYQVG